jgi:putative acetyltransferase
MIVREIRAEDNAAVAAIIRDSLVAHDLAVPGSAYFDPELDDLHGHYRGLRHARYWVAEVDGEVVGGVGIAPCDGAGAVCELQKLYLRPDVQGRGLSRTLMDVALAFAAEHYRRCYLETMRRLESACVLYEKYGFESLPGPLPGSGHSAMDAWYFKRLP